MRELGEAAGNFCPASAAGPTGAAIRCSEGYHDMRIRMTITSRRGRIRRVAEARPLLAAIALVRRDVFARSPAARPGGGAGDLLR